jgi:hypothetical protein
MTAIIPTLDQWIQSLTTGELAPSSSQLANSIKQYYSNQQTPEEYNINGGIEELFHISNIGDLREIFSRLFPEKQKGIIDARSTATRVKDIIKFEANSNKNRINFTFIDKLITIMNLLRERSRQLQRQQPQPQQQCDNSDESCILQGGGGRRKRQMKKKSKRVKAKRSTRRRSSKRHSHYKK